MPVKDAEGGSPVSTLEVNQTHRRGAQRAALDVDPERPDQPYEEARRAFSATFPALTGGAGRRLRCGVGAAWRATPGAALRTTCMPRAAGRARLRSCSIASGQM